MRGEESIGGDTACVKAQGPVHGTSLRGGTHAGRLEYGGETKMPAALSARLRSPACHGTSLFLPSNLSTVL